MGRQYWVLVGISLLVIFGGTWVALQNDQPKEVRMPATGAVGLVIGWWFKSPQQAAAERIQGAENDKS